MITEHAVLRIRPGMEGEFEAAFNEARWIISEFEGFHGLKLLKGVETPNTYLLLVEWDGVADHEAFRFSQRYQEWKALLHHFYDPFPEVEHFETMFRAPDPD